MFLAIAPQFPIHLDFDFQYVVRAGLAVAVLVIL
jgi:preprotein translocase subunit Sec61beta